MTSRTLIAGIAAVSTVFAVFGDQGQYRGDTTDTERLDDKPIAGVNTNMYSYTAELGRVKSKQEVVVGIREKNLLHRGVNAWTDEDEDEGFTPKPSDIYGSGVNYSNMTGVDYNPVSGLTIKDPITGNNVQAAWYFRDAGFEFVSILGTSPWLARYNGDTPTNSGGCYYGVGSKVIETTLPFAYGTNMTKTVECRTMAFPDKTASFDTRQLKNAPDINGEKVPAIADREWVLNLLTNVLNSAGYNVNVTVNADGKITAVSTP